MSVAQFFPWQVEVAQQWLAQRERFAHAWLVHGLAGIGKREFVFAAAAALMCESSVNGLACGQCLACGWVAKGNHPDLKRIRPETLALEEGAEQDEDEGSESAPVAEVTGSSKRAPSKDIRVEQIRSLTPWFNNATHRSGFRVALIYPAEALTHISGNSLLKVLEEPPPAIAYCQHFCRAAGACLWPLHPLPLRKLGSLSRTSTMPLPGWRPLGVHLFWQKKWLKLSHSRAPNGYRRLPRALKRVLGSTSGSLLIRFQKSRQACGLSCYNVLSLM